MTEYSTSNEISHTSPHSQTLHTSPHRRHYQHQQEQYSNAPQYHRQHQNQALYHHQLHNTNNSLPFRQTQNLKNNQQTYAINALTNGKNSTTTTSSTSAITASPPHYKNPLNSPNHSPFTHAYYDLQQYPEQHYNHQQHQHLLSTRTPTVQQQQQQLRLLNSKLSQTNYQKHLNDLLLQQQHLQQQQQQLLSAASGQKNEHDIGTLRNDELSDECLKQNVAIVLNNLDRYSNALRSIILNEQASNSVLDDSVLELSSGSLNSNNNFLLSKDNNKMAATIAAAATPESDYNSNATTPGSRIGSSNLMLEQQQLLQQQQQQQLNHDNVLSFGTTRDVVGGVSAVNNLNCSLASSHDFTHDNSDYQWFLDYGYRDGCGMQRSVLSSLSASCNGIGDMLYYDDLAKNIDANLAEVDIESFRAEDIHSLLSQLPSYCRSLGGGGCTNSRLQQSLMQQRTGAQNMSQISSSSTNELIDNSICKSELLFSPVKESHLSVDSLDLDAYPDDGDIILTCKANKDNYTIAFEGSVLYSDESVYAEPSEILLKNKHNFINLHSNLNDIVQRKPLDVSMSRSEHPLSNSSKMKKESNTLSRYPSGNNNTATNAVTLPHAPRCALVRKSSSLPNLPPNVDDDASDFKPQQLNFSNVSTSTIEFCRSRNLLPMCQMPISCNSNTASSSERLTPGSQSQQQQQMEQQRQHHQHHHRRQQHSALGIHSQQHHSHESSCIAASASSANSHKHQSANIACGTSAASSNQPALNLVKLFIKQKSSSSSSVVEDNAAHTCMDVSSGCWPSSDAAASNGSSSSSSSSSLEHRLRKKSMNDSGKGSALSRHDEELEKGLHSMAAGAIGESYVVSAASPNSAGELHCLRSTHCTIEDVFCAEKQHSATTAPPTTPCRRNLPMRHPHVSAMATRQKSSKNINNNIRINNNNNGSSADSLRSSDGSRSNSEQITQVCVSAKNNLSERRGEQSARTESTNSDMITRSMQTSCGTLSTRSSHSERFRFVPPSFLAKLQNLGEQRQAPIYVIYPNYALPDLGFVKTTTNTPDVIFSPFNFKTSFGGGVAAPADLSLHNKDEILNKVDYRHIIDWKSLATLLPAEYRKRLQHIPEVRNLQLEDFSQMPLFCMSPPVRRAQRAASLCDCAHYFQQQQQLAQAQPAEASSSSGSSQPPSSGYRGSSTLLTDSEMDAKTPTPVATTAPSSDPMQQLYVYQYEQQRRDSADIVACATQSPSTKPTPQPRGILRKTASQSGTVVQNKRNSMYEQQHVKLTKQQKRRSLQEPAYSQHLADGAAIDVLYGALAEEEEVSEKRHTTEVFYADIPPQPKQRLSRKDLDARARAENFLSTLPRSELKYYAEIAAILEASEDQQQAAAVEYDAAALKKEVSRALSQQKKVSFYERQQQPPLQQPALSDTNAKRFSTPPNSPNISVAGGLRMPAVRDQGGHIVRRSVPLSSVRKTAATDSDSKEQLKIASNRFKRLQIQWELLSNDSSMMLKDLAVCELETKSGGSTPTSAQALRSRIPRPVSYPAGKRSAEPAKPVSVSPAAERKGCARIVKPVVSPRITRMTNEEVASKTTARRSPSRIVPPKRYSMSAAAATSTAAVSMARARTTPIASRATTAPNTPKRRVQSPRNIPRTR